MTRIPVRYFTGSLRLGGTERNILHLATRLDPARFDVEVWSDYEGEPIQEQLRARGVVCRSLKSGASIGKPFLSRLFLYNLPYQRRLFGALWKNHDAIIHVFSFPMAYYVALLGNLAGCDKMILSVQDWDVWKRSGIYSLLDRVCSRIAARVIADGEGARKLAIRRQGMAAEKVTTIHDGVNTEDLTPKRSAREVRVELGLDPDRVTFGTIARLDMAKKGQDVLLKAIPEVFKQAPGAQFLIVGDGPDHDEISRRVDRLPYGPRVALPGFRSDLAEMLNAIDALVIPSRWESVPKILLEAMALGKPVIATRVGDIEEVLDENCGVLVRPDSPQELTSAIVRLSQDGSLREKFGRSGAELIRERRLTLDDTIHTYESIYEEIAHGRR